MELKQAIRNLGFSDKESAVYLAVLDLGQSTAYQIATRSGLKKPTTYVILDGLIERGAVRKIPISKKAQYVATDPVELFVEARSRVEQVEAVLPKLQALAKTESKTLQTSYFEGLEGIKLMYKNLLREAAGKIYVGFFAHAKDTPKELLKYWEELNADMVKRKIKIRGITTKDETTKPYLEFKIMPKELLELVGLPTNIYSSNISIEIYNDYTQITSHRYLQGVLIRNPDIANVLRQIFEIVWKASDK